MIIALFLVLNNKTIEYTDQKQDQIKAIQIKFRVERK